MLEAAQVAGRVAAGLRTMFHGAALALMRGRPLPHEEQQGAGGTVLGDGTRQQALEWLHRQRAQVANSGWNEVTMWHRPRRQQ